MKKMIYIFVAILLMLSTVGCDGADQNISDDRGGDDSNASAFVLTAVVTGISADGRIEVNADVDDTQAPYWVLTSTNTAFLDKNGEAIDLTDIKVGDRVQIHYSGQVMLSYPPQIAATKIKLQ